MPMRGLADVRYLLKKAKHVEKLVRNAQSPSFGTDDVKLESCKLICMYDVNLLILIRQKYYCYHMITVQRVLWRRKG